MLVEHLTYGQVLELWGDLPVKVQSIHFLLPTVHSAPIRVSLNRYLKLYQTRTHLAAWLSHLPFLLWAALERK